MLNKFVILGMQRTGSNMLVSALDSHPRIRCYGELFSQRRADAFNTEDALTRLPDRYHTVEGRNEDPVAFLGAVESCMTDVDSFGFKLFFPQNERALDYVLEHPEWRKVFIYRENVLASYSSGLIAKSTGQGTARVGEERKTTTVTFDAKGFEKFEARRARLYAAARSRLEANGQSWMEVEYLSACEAETQNKVAAYVGADPSMALTTGTQKRNPARILERFDNPQTVTAYLNQVGHASWVEERSA